MDFNVSLLYSLQLYNEVAKKDLAICNMTILTAVGSFLIERYLEKTRKNVIESQNVTSTKNELT